MSTSKWQDHEDFKKPGKRFSYPDWERGRDTILAKIEYIRLELMRVIANLKADIPRDLDHRLTVVEIQLVNHQTKHTSTTLKGK